MITDTETPYDTEADMTDADCSISTMVSVDEEGPASIDRPKDKLRRMSTTRSRTDLDVRQRAL